MLAKFVDEKFPLWVKIVLCVFGFASGVYRIFVYVDDAIAKKADKNVKALVFGILCVIPIIGLIMAIIDIIALVTANKFSAIGR